MNELPYLASIYDRLKRGYHLGPEDEPEFTALCQRFQDYADFFGEIGLKLVRHEREFFYFDPDNPETVPDTLPRIAVFGYIMIDHAANQGRSIEEFVFGQNFLLTALPHFALDRYTALLRQVDVNELSDVRTLLKHMERIGWVKWVSEDEFRFARPFHRVFSKCLEIAAQSANANQEPGIPGDQSAAAPSPTPQ
jgi:chromosome condensin MukBEF MukE localization factor